MNTEKDGVLTVVNGSTFTCYRNGDLYRYTKYGYWKMVHNISNNTTGYNSVWCFNKKIIFRHRILFYAFNNTFDIYNPHVLIDHIDGNPINNELTNLRLVTNQENQHNQHRAKGYTYINKRNKWQSFIHINKKQIYLGYYNTRWEARQAYIDAIPIYHPSAPIHLYTNDEDDCPFKSA